MPVDYSAMYDSDVYLENQVRALRDLTDRAAFAGVATYRPFFRRVRRKQGSRLLDIGCGVGRFCHAAYWRGWDVTGIDISARAIEIGRAVATFPMRHASLDELAAEGGQYDVVTCFEVLEHLANPRDFLASVAGVLAPGGEVFCTVPNWDNRQVQTTTRPDWLPPVHLGFFTRTALRSLGDQAGFARVATGPIKRGWTPPGGLPTVRWCYRLLRAMLSPAIGLWLQMHSDATHR